MRSPPAFAMAVLAVFASATPSLAATQESKQHSITLEPFQASQDTLACTSGELVSGGYTLQRVTGGFGVVAREQLVIHTNGPAADGQSWAIGFINVGEVPMAVEFSILILCG